MNLVESLLVAVAPLMPTFVVYIVDPRKELFL
jgi:hypothetical protein